MTFRAALIDEDAGAHKHRRPLSYLLVAVLAIAVFGPYVIGSIRTDQVAVYGLAVFVLIMNFKKFQPRAGLPLLVTWVAFTLIALLGIVFPSRVVAAWEGGNVLAGLGYCLLPLAIMLMVWSSVRTADAPQLLNLLAKVVVVAMAINGIIAIVGTQFDLTFFLRAFWAASGDTLTVAENAAGNGRLSGIFNQPAEAGIMYGLAGLLAIYVWSEKPVRLTFMLALISVGGLLCVSKVFILGGLPLILYFWWRSSRGSRKGVMIVAIVLATLGIVQSGLLSAWTGADYLVRLLAPTQDQSLLGFYTAGRIQTGSAISAVSGEVMRISPLTGVGAGGWKVAYDSGFIESIVMGGIFGVVFYSLALVAIFVIALRTVDVFRRRFTYLLGIFLVGASFGIPALTANRASTVIWLAIALLVVAQRLPAKSSLAVTEDLRQ